MTSFDRTEIHYGALVKPERYRDLVAELTGDRPAIPRGAGLSYCNASAGNDVVSVSSKHFNRFLKYDPENRTVDLEPGVTVGELLRFCLARGSYPAVLPGYPQITVGGCIGFNVHGKSQHHTGNFSGSLAELLLYHPDHGDVRCSREERPELFHATLGGFGLTGWIKQARLQLVPLAGQSLVRETFPVADLFEALAVMTERAKKHEAVYSWNDLARRGKGFGSGMVYCERFSEEPTLWSRKFRAHSMDEQRVPLPSIQGRFVTPVINWLYGGSERVRPRKTRLSIEAGTFPINGREGYFRLFGSRGFREYQMLLARPAWEHVVGELRRLLRIHSVAPTLASLKLFSGQRRLLNFTGDGVCIALDVPNTPGALSLFASLDRVVEEARGVVNLSKDSRLSRQTVRGLFPEYDRFVGIVSEFDYKRRFDSGLRRRLLG